jgi:hypothetical protein
VLKRQHIPAAQERARQSSTWRALSRPAPAPTAGL